MRTTIGEVVRGASSRGWNRSARPLCVLAVLAMLAPAGNGVADDSGNHLFRPTSRERMRELSTDRPDVTESPYTVDAGHVQIEMDLVSYTRDRGPLARNEAWSVAASNLKLGLHRRVDLQLVHEPYVRSRLTPELGEPAEQTNRGDFTARLKINAWGNDGGATALAVMPFVTLPTRSDDGGEVGGGVIVPLAIEAPLGMGAGLMVESGHVEGSAYWLASATLGRDLIGPLGGFVELVGARPWSGGGLLSTLDAGLTAGLTPDVQLDGGVMIGLSDEADDLTVFAGLALRR